MSEINGERNRRVLLTNLATQLLLSHDQTADSLLCAFTSEVMHDRLKTKRHEGRYGWYDPNVLQETVLWEKVEEAFMEAKTNRNTNKLIDTINLAAMLLFRRCNPTTNRTGK